MSKNIQEALLDLKARQEAGEKMPCPRCGRDTMKPDLYTNALSRHADGIYVCDDCGTAEAMLDFMRNPLPLECWAQFREGEATADFKAVPGEEALKDLRALRAQDIVQDLGLVVEVRILQDVEEGPAAAGLGAGRADHDAVDPGLDDGAGAHLAGLQGAVEGAALQPPVAELLTGLTDAGDLGVGQCGLVRVAAVVAAGDDLSLVDDDRPDGDLPDRDRLLRLLQGGLHIFDILRGDCGDARLLRDLGADFFHAPYYREWEREAQGCRRLQLYFLPE